MMMTMTMCIIIMVIIIHNVIRALGFLPYEQTFLSCMAFSIYEVQGLQILLMSGVTVTSASQILESFWKIWSQVSQRKKPFSDFTACGPGMNNYRDGYMV